MKMPLFLPLMVALSGCASLEVRCDGRVQPINLPRPRIAASAAPTPRASQVEPPRTVP
jgi:hypothetical protein